MRGGEAFEEVLDQHIQGLEADRRVTFTTSRCSTATAYGFFFPPSPVRGHGEAGVSHFDSERLRIPAPSHPPSPLRGYGETGLSAVLVAPEPSNFFRP